MTREFTNKNNQAVFEQWLLKKETLVKPSGMPQYRSGAFAIQDVIATKDFNDITPQDVLMAYQARTKKQAHTATFLLDCFTWDLIDVSSDTLRFLMNKDNYNITEV